MDRQRSKRHVFPLWHRLYTPGTTHSMKAHPYLIVSERFVGVVLLSTYMVQWV